MAGRRRTGAYHARGSDQKRQRIIQEAARIMAEEGVRDFHAAKRKAAGRVGQDEHRNLPSNREVEEALTGYLQLFHSRELPQMLQRLLTIARDAMLLLGRFEPRLVGPLLNGVATPFMEVSIHAFADDPEQVALLLHDHAIPYEDGSRRLRFGGERQENVPFFRFVAGDTRVEICTFPPHAMREAPLSPVDARPMRRASLKEVEQLLAERMQLPSEG
jgi:hypothetical protein